MLMDFVFQNVKLEKTALIAPPVKNEVPPSTLDSPKIERTWRKPPSPLSLMLKSSTGWDRGCGGAADDLRRTPE
jgi:hypothetical protein